MNIYKKIIDFISHEYGHVIVDQKSDMRLDQVIDEKKMDILGIKKEDEWEDVE